MKRRRTPKPKPPLGVVWWVFKLRSGEIKKHYGNDLRELTGTLEVWNDHIFLGSIKKGEIVDRWAQDQETTDRERL